MWALVGLALVAAFLVGGRVRRLPGRVGVCLVVRDQEAAVEGLAGDALAWAQALGSGVARVVVLDAGSRDGTARVLEHLARRHPALKILRWPDDTVGKGDPLEAALAAMPEGWVLLCRAMPESGPPLTVGELCGRREGEGACR